MRPVGVEELKAAWRAVSSGEFATDPNGARTSTPTPATVTAWSPATGERTIAVIGCAGSAGASTLALAAALTSADPVRVIECCSVTDSGLAAASTAELGLHPADWRQGKRDHVLLERTIEVLATAAEVPLPTENPHDGDCANQLTIFDVGWDIGQLLATDCWLAEAVRTADQLILVTTATVPGFRRASVALDLLAAHWQPEQIRLAVRGPRRKKWPRGLEHAGGPSVRRALAAERCVEIPEDRDLAVNGLDSKPVPAPVIAAARQALEPTPQPTPQPMSQCMSQPIVPAAARSDNP